MAGEIFIDLHNVYEKELWDLADKQPEIIAKEIYDVKGKYVDDNSGEEMTIELDDIVVCCCVWHCGRKDKNPLEAVRFVKKKELGKPIIPMGEPAGHMKTRFYYDCQRNCIRIFCRDPAKQALLIHMFEDWEENRQARWGTAHGFEVVQESFVNEVSNGGDSFSARPVALTQDSDGDMMSPARSEVSRNDYLFGSPIPVPKFDTLSRLE